MHSETIVALQTLQVPREACRHHCLSHNFLCDQGGPSLPASLTAIRLESDDNIELEKLRCSDSRLSAAAGLALVVTAGSIDCKQEWMCNRLDRAAEHASKLPAGFTALELRASHISLTFSIHGLRATPAVAAYLLSMFFAFAPASYRRFRMCWPDSLPLRILVADMIDDWTCEGSDSEFKALDSDEVEALTEHMRRSAGRLGMSVNVMKEAEMNCINVIRLWNKLRSSQCEPSAR